MRPLPTWWGAFASPELEPASEPGALPVLAAIVIGLPLVGVLAGFFWVKIRDRDDPAGPVLRPGRDPDDDEVDDDDRGGGPVAEG